MDQEPLAAQLRAAPPGIIRPRTDEITHRPITQRKRNETLRAAALAAGLDHHAARRAHDGIRPHILTCIALAEHFEVNPNEFLKLAGWPTLKAFDIRTASAEKLPPEAVDVAMDIAKIPEPGVRREVVDAIRTLLRKYIR